MNMSLFALLRCPACFNGKLEHTIEKFNGDQVLEGSLRCSGCDRGYPIREGILDALTPIDRGSRPVSPLNQGGQWMMEQRWFSRTYERLLRPLLIGVAGSPAWLRREGDFLANSHQMPPDEVMLDAACGPGHWSRLLAQRSPARHVIGVDISASMLEQSRRRNQEEGLEKRISLVRADVARLPFVDRAFGGVNCFTAFHLFPDMEAAVAELARVLRPGRRLTALVVTEPETLLRRPAARLLERLGQMHFPPATDVRRLLWRHRIATVDEASEGMVLLLTGMMAEHSRRSVATVP